MRRTVAILGTGDMGSAVAKSLVATGVRVTTSLAGRSDRSIERAKRAGMEDRGSLEDLVADADMLLSIVPPAAAYGFAAETCPLIQAAGSDTLFIDCNAVSPKTLDAIAGMAAAHSVRFHDIGIVGAAPRPGRKPVRFYASGMHTDAAQGLATALIDVRPLGERPGRASALKMVYASLTKGTNALRAAALIAGEALGVGDEIRAEWAYSVPDAWKTMESRMSYFPSVADRWAGEMKEIADTYASVGVTPSFHDGAEWVYALLATADVAPDDNIDAAIAAFMAALEKR